MAKQLRIGILGAPGSGKEAMIAHFVREIDDFQRVVPIQNSGRILQTRFDVAAGAFGTYREDLWALFETARLERELSLQGASFISNGTHLSNLAHAVTNLDTIQQGVQVQSTQAEVIARQYTLAVMTMLVIEHTNYNFVFRLPWPAEPGEMDDFEWYYGSKVERAIGPTLEQLGLLHRLQTLKPGTPEEQALEAIETVKLRYDKIQSSDEPSTSADS